ncbi:MAG: outer membrane beta-barrel protein [Kofleriaceae bacterium]
MHARSLALSLAPLSFVALASLTSVAHAQAAGELAPEDAVAGPPEAPAAEVEVQAEVQAEVQIGPSAPAPVAVQVITPASTPVRVACATARPRASVMANRWAVGLSLGSMSLAPESSPDDQTNFAVGELAVRFRATRHLELELSAGGGREQTADDENGDLEVAAVTLAARYRFRPEAAWNWFVMGGIGGAAVTRHDATDEQRNNATQPLGMLGIGLERRFRHFALQVEARAVGLGKRDDSDTMDARPLNEAARATPIIEVPTRTDEARSGGSLALGLSYYF